MQFPREKPTPKGRKKLCRSSIVSGYHTLCLAMSQMGGMDIECRSVSGVQALKKCTYSKVWVGVHVPVTDWKTKTKPIQTKTLFYRYTGVTRHYIYHSIITWGKSVWKGWKLIVPQVDSEYMEAELQFHLWQMYEFPVPSISAWFTTVPERQWVRHRSH